MGLNGSKNLRIYFAQVSASNRFSCHGTCPKCRDRSSTQNPGLLPESNIKIWFNAVLLIGNLYFLFNALNHYSILWNNIMKYLHIWKLFRKNMQNFYFFLWTFVSIHGKFQSASDRKTIGNFCPWAQLKEDFQTWS